MSHLLGLIAIGAGFGAFLSALLWWAAVNQDTNEYPDDSQGADDEFVADLREWNRWRE